MALQGTLETFALPDVLRLLASTKKTGAYRLDGNRGSGTLWVKEGQVVGGEVTGSPTKDAREVAFELLRYSDGDFVFDADAEADETSEPVDVETLLTDAEQLLSEWKEIEAVVPSLDHGVTLNPELPGDEVTIRADIWLYVVVIGGGTTVGGLGAKFGLGELGASRAVKQLVELGLVTLSDPGTVTAPAPQAAEPEPVPAQDDFTIEEPVAAESDDFFSADASDEFEPFDPNALVIEEPPLGEASSESSSSMVDSFLSEPVAAEPEPEPEPEPAPASTASDPTDAAEIARQLANLSPKAAKAVAAAAKATTQEEREAALAEVDDSEDPINRELLLKFLGSVNS